MTFLAAIGSVYLITTALGQLLPGEAGKAFRKVGCDLQGLITQAQKNS